MSLNRIPAMIRIDIEPDDHVYGPGKVFWSGLAEYAVVVNGLRKALTDKSGGPFIVNWFPRFDPALEYSCGRPDEIYRQHQALLHDFQRQGDVFGIHVHAHRWDEQRQVLFSDYANIEWTLHCVRRSVEVFTDCFGTPPLRSSQGGYFLSDELLAESAKLGIQVDATPEPGLRPKTEDPSMGAYVTQPTTDFSNFPQQPYFPAVGAIHRPAAKGEARHDMMLLPLTSFDYRMAEAPLYKKIYKKLRGYNALQPLSPWRDWGSPARYWDVVMMAMDAMEHPYYATAIRTDNVNSDVFARARDILEYLPKHPIATRFQFVDCLSPEITRLAKPSRNC